MALALSHDLLRRPNTVSEQLADNPSDSKVVKLFPHKPTLPWLGSRLFLIASYAAGAAGRV